ncbi:MAG: hypothetical protein MRJ65_15010 [Candidatus Brocadiaceae bacterium]|nr:hypothetical protein [Candidatus Brocadiaceae bacterium]
MYTINKFKFDEFKITPGHRANYAILTNPEFQEKQWGMKYHPSNDYSREFKVLTFFSHPQIPVRHKVGNDTMYKEDKFVLDQHYLVMTHFEGEGIDAYYKRKDLPDQQEIERIVKYFSSITSPLHHMHSAGYIHCDIKPGHLILNPETGIIALIDLECTIKTGEIIRGMTREYASPEQKQMIQLLRSGNENEKSIVKKVRLGPATDLYAVGLILYQTITGKLWQESPINPREINKAVPDTLNKVILGLLEENPANRIGAAEALKKELEAI